MGDKGDARASATVMEMTEVDAPSGKGMSVYEGERKSYQARALIRKTLSYQKRQTCTNVCCVLACPLLLVAICGILGVVVAALISNSNPVIDVQYCSPNAKVDPNTLLPGQPAQDADGRYLYGYNPRGECVLQLSRDSFESLPYTPTTNPTCDPRANPELCPLSPPYDTAPVAHGWYD